MDELGGCFVVVVYAGDKGMTHTLDSFEDLSRAVIKAKQATPKHRAVGLLPQPPPGKVEMG